MFCWFAVVVNSIIYVRHFGHPLTGQRRVNIRMKCVENLFLYSLQMCRHNGINYNASDLRPFRELGDWYIFYIGWIWHVSYHV